ncbi:cell division protein FtsQ/DivIB [Paenibacillus gansuensis]|uniref:Cell division protein FtsQ/DivIB n=1 Tax=Paenibacillus gansuensis TaxID=306542 RepID=A0ABW5PBW0_9BACL
MANITQLPVLREQKVKRRGSRKLLYLLLFLFMVLLAILFFRSSFSKVKTIEIKGNHYLTTQEISQALDVKVGDQFFGTTSGAMKRRIGQLLPIEQVVIHKKFPGYILIEIREQKTVAFQLSPKEGKLMAILSGGGTVIPKTNRVTLDKPVLSGWDGKEALMKKLCLALAKVQDGLLSDISEIKPDPSNAYPDRILLYTRSRFEVSTTISYLPQKAEYINAVIDGQEPGRITMLEADFYTPYVPEASSGDENSQNDTTQ